MAARRQDASWFKKNLKLAGAIFDNADHMMELSVFLPQVTLRAMAAGI